VSKAITEVLGLRQALYHVMTGENFDGKRAAEMGLVNEAVPAERLKARTEELACVLMTKNPTVLRQAKIALKYARDMTWDEAAEYLAAKSDQTILQDPERGREQGMKQFLDEKSYRPGLGGYKREE